MVGPETLSTSGVIERSFALLQAVVASGEPVGVRELERRTGIPRSTVSRVVSTLVSLGMLDRTTAGEVRPGAALATLHTAEVSRAGISDQLRPLLVELVDRFGESAALTTDDGAAVQYLLQIASPQAVQAPSVENERHEYHLVAPGLVHMAGWPQDRIAGHLAEPLVAATDHSVCDANEVSARLAGIRASGWAWTDQELDVGVNGLAVPVLDGNDRPIAAISLFGPAYRFAEPLLPHLAAELAALVAVRSRTYL
jgi:DNA-binding IclR family transcriptional regulator